MNSTENAASMTNASSMRLQAMLDMTLTFICYCDADGRLLEVNDAPLAAAAFSREDVLGQLFWQTPWWGHSDTESQKIEQAIRRAAGGETTRQRCLASFSENLIAPVECVFAPYRDADGQIVGVVGTGMDLTEQALVERDLGRERERLSQAQRIAKIGSWELDHHSGELAWSDEVYRMFGLERHELRPSYQGFLEHVHPDDRAAVDDAYRSSLENQHPYEIIHRVEPAQGATIWVREQCETEFDSHGTPLISRGTVQDISEQHLASEKLVENETTLRSVFQASPEAIVVANSKGEILMFSHGAEIMFRCQSQDVVGQHFECLIPERFRQAHVAYVDRFRESHEMQLRMSERSDISGLRSDGDEFPAEASVTKSIVPSGMVYTVVLRDMTLRQTYESTLINAKHQADASNRAKSSFLATMSHEIRTPLNGVLGILSVLKGAPMASDQKRMIDIANEAGWSLLKTLNDVLDYSKIEADRVSLEQVEFSPTAIIERVVALFRPSAEQKGLRLNAHIADDMPHTIVGDPVSFERVLQNLISNAIKFTESGAVSIGANGRAQHGQVPAIEVAVRDSGIGIPSDQLKDIFDRFTQADSSTTRKFGGTGLGLSIARGIVEQMGGRISVKSEEGVGSDFVVELPVQASTESVTSIAVASSDEERVLIVEDNLLNAETLEFLVAETDRISVVTHNGIEALEAFEPGLFKFVLMDIQMPEMDGETAMREMRRREGLKGDQTPAVIIACTAHVHDGETERYVEEGFDLVLPKPITAARLREALGRLDSTKPAAC
ncbi:MAG: PAS domain S-box-containing protein [Maricaulis maris]|jgi:PAS domain S-box-containing protein